MKNLPPAFWAVLLAAMGWLTGLVILFSPATEQIKLAVLSGIGVALISGGLGFIAGHSTATAGTTEVNATTVNPITPANPAQPK